MKKVLLFILTFSVIVASQDWFEPQNLNYSISGLDDVNLTWDRPAGAKAATLIEYNIYRNGDPLDVVSESVTAYDDIDVSSGSYYYNVTGVYVSPDGESLFSDTCWVEIVHDPQYWAPGSPSAETQGRHAIDLSWYTPYNQVHFLEEDWESGGFASSWIQRRSTEFPPEQRAFQTAAVNDPKWFEEDGTVLGSEYVHGGSYSAAINYDAPGYTWLFSPVINYFSPANLRYWEWVTGDSVLNRYTKYHVVLYTGDFSENKPADNCYIEASFTIDQSNENKYGTEVLMQTAASISVPYRLAFVFEQSNGFEMALDDIDLFATDMQIGFEVYRDEIKIAETVGTYYSDTDFADGDNEYYVKTKFIDGGTSIASDRATAFIYANPAPGYLTGVLNNDQVDLSWYAPLHQPPHWFGFTDDMFESYFDYIDGMTGTWAERRTLFTASGLGTGYAYPFTLDSLSAAFYDSGTGWTDQYFQYEVWTTNYAGTADSTIWQSTDQAAVSGSWHTAAIPSQLTMNWGWYVSLHVNNDGTPSSFVNVGPDNDHSTVYYGGDGTYTAGWYSITFGDSPGDWAILCFGQGAVDEWYYNKAEAPEEKLTLAPNGILKGTVKPGLNAAADNSKALVRYNIYIDGSFLDYTTNTYYTYAPIYPTKSDSEFWVTAVYSDPAGESDPSNSYFVSIWPYINPILPPIIWNDGTYIYIEWGLVSGATGYNVYASEDPYGIFTYQGYTTVSPYSELISQSKKFYYITATDEVKKAPAKIVIKDEKQSK